MCYISNLVNPNFVITYDICSPYPSLIAQKADAATTDKNTKGTTGIGSHFNFMFFMCICRKAAFYTHQCH